MLESNLSKVIRNDINLLVTLYFLLKTRQVSKAAKQLYIGQSAVSHQLARLREIFDDTLLIKTSNGMQLTPFAQRLYPMLEVLVIDLEILFEVQHEDAQNSPLKDVYRICVPDDIYIDDISLLLHDFALSERLENRVVFEVFSRYDQSVSDLNEGKIDFFFGHLGTLSSNVCVSELMELECFLGVRDGHPLAGREVLLSEIVKFQIVEVMFREQMYKLGDEIWGKSINQMTCILKTSSAGAAVALLKHSDAMCVFPEDAINRRGLRKVSVRGKRLKMKINLYWHKIMENDAFHRRIRNGLLRHFVIDQIMP